MQGKKIEIIYNQKNKLNENKSYLQTKISIKIKIRDKNKFTKNFMESNFQEAIFLGRGQFSGR